MIKLTQAEVEKRSGELKNSPLFEALKRLPSLGEFGPWVAGGAVRRTFLGSKLDTDIDFFFADSMQYNAFKSDLQAMGGLLKSENDQNSTFILPAIGLSGSPSKISPELKIQLIKITYYSNLNDVLDSFDYTICQFGYDGTNFVVSDFAMVDLANKKLVPHKITYGVSSLRRLLKYTNQGFTVCAGGLAEILKQVSENPSVIQQEIQYID